MKYYVRAVPRSYIKAGALLRHEIDGYLIVTKDIGEEDRIHYIYHYKDGSHEVDSISYRCFNRNFRVWKK
jgi:hypothetical protein